MVNKEVAFNIFVVTFGVIIPISLLIVMCFFRSRRRGRRLRLSKALTIALAAMLRAETCHQSGNSFA